MDNTSLNKGWIEQVYEGMEAYDVDGNHMGKIQMVKMGDPEAITTEGNQGGVVSGFTPLTSEYNEPEVPQPLRDDLLRNGFVKIDGKGLFDQDKYFRADVIDRVEDGKVFMRLPASRAAVEGEESNMDRAPVHSERAGGAILMPPAGVAPLIPNSGVGSNQ